MSSWERRLARLEDQYSRGCTARDPDQIAERARRAVEDGSATLDQYRLAHADDISYHRERFLAQSPLLFACARSGLFISGIWSALALPPDQPPGAEADGWFALLTNALEPLDSPRRRRPDSMGPFEQFYLAEGRAQAAVVLLACGAHEGLEIRRRAWVKRGGEWRMSPEANKASRDDGFTWLECGSFFTGRPITGWHLKPAEFNAKAMRDPSNDETWVSFASLARLVLRSGSREGQAAPYWSEQLRSAHNA